MALFRSIDPKLTQNAKSRPLKRQQKVRKTPDFKVKSGVFMVAEAGLRLASLAA